MKQVDKHPSMVVHERRPFNAEPPLACLRQSFLTPRDLFFSRNHGTIPEVDPATGRVFVTGKTDGQLQVLEPR